MSFDQAHSRSFGMTSLSMACVNPYRRLKAYFVLIFLGRKINLSGISPAKRSRSGPNSVHVNRSKGDNFQGILSAIGSFRVKRELGRVPRSASFFVVIHKLGPFGNFATADFHRIWPRKVGLSRCSVDESGLCRHLT